MAEVKIALEADEQGMIENRVFDGDTIVGPAMLAPAGDPLVFRGNEWGAPFDQMFHATDKTKLVGVIGLQNVTFRNCTFRRVGFMGSEEFIALIGKDLLEEGDPQA